MHYLETGSYKLDEEGLDKALCKIEERLGVTGEFSVHFVSDEEIRTLNREYRDRDEATDILTFAMNDGEGFIVPEEEEDLGDLFISLESMRRNAQEFGVSEEEELKRLLLHGVMHLLGYDHETNDFSKEPMLIEQEKLMQELF